MSATKEQIWATVEACRAVADCVKELGQVPSGHLYARLMEHMNLEQYNAFIAALKRAGLVAEQNFMLTWVGPK